MGSRESEFNGILINIVGDNTVVAKLVSLKLYPIGASWLVLSESPTFAPNNGA